MSIGLITGNHAAGYALSTAAEANRFARGAVAGIYPITPQTEIVERVQNFKFTKCRVVPVESEHSAMGVCMGGSLAGARSFTASSSNGLAYMAENVFAAGFYRLPIVMVAVNRTLGPPWNIWADQGDTLALRDAPWVQLYCESNQEVLDTTLLAFRLGEDQRTLLPIMVIMDAFILSHTQTETDMPDQDEVDRYLPPCNVPHQLSHDHPVTIGGLIWPRETASQRYELDQAMNQVEDVYRQAQDEFHQVFGRQVAGPIEPYRADDADTLLLTSGSITNTARTAVDEARASGRRIGLLKIKMFRPFPREPLMRLCKRAKRIGVLDRNYSPGSGGIFWQEVRATLQGNGEVMVQSYLIGLCGMDVTSTLVHEVIDDLYGRRERGDAQWVGLT